MLKGEGILALVFGAAGVFWTAGLFAAGKGVMAGVLIGALLAVLFMMGLIVGKNLDLE